MKAPGAPWHPFLFGSWLVLLTTRDLGPFVDLRELLLALAAMNAVIAGVQFVFRRTASDPERSAILLSLGIVGAGLFCGVEAWLVHLLPGWLLALWNRPSFWLVPLLGGSWLAALWLVWRSPRPLTRLRQYLTIVGALLVLDAAVEAAWLGVQGWRAWPGAVRTPPTPTRAPLRRLPDVYYIILDGYTSQESLRRFWGYDNTPFLDVLAAHGFRVVPDAKANYDQTMECMAAALGMDYPPVPPSGFAAAAKESWLRRAIRDAAAPRLFRESGYEIINLSPFRLGATREFCTYAGSIPTSVAASLLKRSAAGFFVSHLEHRRVASLEIFARLSELARTPSPRPRFVYAHVLMPHPPYLFDRQGRRWPAPRGADTQQADYLEQLRYVNQLAATAIRAILQADATPTPVIIVQGDHGSRALGDAGQGTESRTILNAYRLADSGADAVYPGITPVNTFRLVLNQCLGTRYPFLPDR